MAVSSEPSIRDEAQYDRAIANLNYLLDEVGTDDTHPLYGLLDALGTMIAAYEAEHVVLPAAGGIETMTYLMDEHGLRQSDLPEIGSQGVVSEILSGKRQLNVRQIQALAESRTTRSLTDEECRKYLHVPACPASETAAR